MPYFMVMCDAPGGLGPSAKFTYDEKQTYIKEVQYLDLEFEVWLGGEVVQNIGCFCVTAKLWQFLKAKGVKGVDVRDMTVTVGEYMQNYHPDVAIPEFKELVIPRTLQAQKVADAWFLEAKSIPASDVFSGFGIPLFVNDRAKEILKQYGVTNVSFQPANVVDHLPI